METAVLSLQTPTLRDAARAVVRTDSSVAPALLRLTLGAVLLPHGAQHLLGWFGGYSFAGSMDWMTGTLGIPATLAAVGIIIEFTAPLLLIAGMATRPAALALAGFMSGAAVTHLPSGFFMNWSGTMPAGTEGYEYHLLAIAMTVAVASTGGGAASVDRLLTLRSR